MLHAPETDRDGEVRWTGCACVVFVGLETWNMLHASVFARVQMEQASGQPVAGVHSDRSHAAGFYEHSRLRNEGCFSAIKSSEMFVSSRDTISGPPPLQRELPRL